MYKVLNIHDIHMTPEQLEDNGINCTVAEIAMLEVLAQSAEINQYYKLLINIACYYECNAIMVNMRNTSELIHSFIIHDKTNLVPVYSVMKTTVTSNPLMRFEIKHSHWEKCHESM